jgi:thioredoxin 1
MSKPAAVTDSTFQQEVINGSNDKPVLVDFWAAWCGPCKMLAPTIEQIAEEKAGSLKVVKLDVDDNPEVAGKYGILSIPTMILFKDGKPAAQLVGNQPKARILSQLDPHISVKTE